MGREAQRCFPTDQRLSEREPGPVLAYYNPNKALWLQVDASKNGWGTVLLQKEKPIEPIQIRSKQNYAQIKKELYAVLFGCKRFHQYVYGRAFIHGIHVNVTALCRPTTPTAHVFTASEIRLHIDPQTRQRNICC